MTLDSKKKFQSYVLVCTSKLWLVLNDHVYVHNYINKKHVIKTISRYKFMRSSSINEKHIMRMIGHLKKSRENKYLVYNKKERNNNKS